MLDKKVTDIVSNLTEQVVSKLKKEEDLGESIPMGGGPSSNPYLKLTQVKNGYILELNSQNPAEAPETEVIEMEDTNDPESIINMLYGLSEWLGVEDVKKLNITYDGVVSRDEPPEALKKDYTEENAKEINRQALQKSFDDDKPKIAAKEEYIPKPKPAHKITKEDVIRAAMGLPPEETIKEGEVDDDDVTTDEPEGTQLQVQPEDYEMEEENLKENEWIDRDYGDDPNDNLSEDQYKELDDLPDGDFDEGEGPY